MGDQNIRYDGAKNLFVALTHLAELGLLSCIFDNGYSMNGAIPNKTVYYFDRPVKIENLVDHQEILKVGWALLSRAGEELSMICGSEPSKECYETTLKEWIKSNYVLSCPIDGKEAHVIW